MKRIWINFRKLTHLMKQELLPHKQNIALFIKTIGELNEDYVIQDNKLHRFKKKFKLNHYIIEILQDYPDGLHFREITSEIMSRYNISVDERKVHAHLTKTWSYDQFINIWLWIYTLKGTWEYSWEKTPDLIYRFLKESNSPKTVAEIQEYVSKRKKVEMKTIRVAIDYPKEFRFCFYNDGKVWLKEWKLWNERDKVQMKKYDLSLNSTLKILIQNGILYKGLEFDKNELIELIKKSFLWKEIAVNERAIYSVLEKYIQEWILKKRNISDKNIYSLNQ